MFDKFTNKILTFKKENCQELVPIAEYSGIVALCKLFTSLASSEEGVSGRRAPAAALRFLSSHAALESEYMVRVTKNASF